MSTNEFDIDDILLEAEKLRNKAERSSSKEESYSDFEPQDKEVFSEFSKDDVEEKRKKEDFFAFVDKIEEEELEVEDEPEPPVLKKREFKIRKKEDEPVSRAENSRKPPARPTTKPPKKDLFEFTPEKRETPIKSPFGHKGFDFSRPETVFDETTKEKPEPKIKIEELEPTREPDYLDETFDFASISDKIEKMNEDKEAPKSPRQQTPFNFGGAVQSISDKARSRNKYADLASGTGTSDFTPQKRFSFDFNKTASTAQSGDTSEETDYPEGFAETAERRSLFASFTGTGKELKLEDIKRINFSEVEGAGGAYLDDEDYYYEEDHIPDGRAVELGEFKPESNRRDISRDIATTKMGYFIRTMITGALTAILFYFVFAAKYAVVPMLPFIQPVGETVKAYIIACTVLTALVGVVCAGTVWSGILSTVRMRANSDALPTFAIIAAIIQGIIAVRNPDLIQLSAMSLYFPVAALTMLFNCIGKLVMLGRIQLNFRITASKQSKNTVMAVESSGYARELIKHTTEHRPTVAYSAKSDFFSDFMALSSSNKYDVGVNRAVVPVCLIAALFVTIVTRFLSDNPMTAATAFASVLCICATFSTSFIENIPLGKMAKKLTPMGAMVSGNKAVETFCDTDAVILTEVDLFPKGHVYLNGIKAFPNARIDEAILDAASVLCALGGSLSHVFLDMIGGDKQLLKKVDNVVYENDMGLSGWVDERRVLIGNRKLMQNHGIPLPEDSYERAHPKDTPGNPIYLSNSGEVSARFLVEYIIDEELAYQLDMLAAKEKQLVIYTTDANIDARKVWELYGYPMDLTTIMPSELQDGYREMSQPRKETPAEIVYIGRPAGFIASILAAVNARASILSATIIQLAQIIIGYGVVALMSFMGYIENFSIAQLALYQAFWFVAILIVQQSRKP